jgi:hypothetical protein
MSSEHARDNKHFLRDISFACVTCCVASSSHLLEVGPKQLRRVDGVRQNVFEPVDARLRALMFVSRCPPQRRFRIFITRYIAAITALVPLTFLVVGQSEISLTRRSRCHLLARQVHETPRQIPHCQPVRMQLQLLAATLSFVRARPVPITSCSYRSRPDIYFQPIYR